MIERWLADPRWLSLFDAQSNADQRHAFACGQAIAEQRPGNLELIRAALLHDIGKRHAEFGIVRRTVSGAASKIGVRLPGSYALYKAHGSLGANELEAAGASELVVSFTRHHHGERPSGFPKDEWRLLVSADDEQ